MVTVVMITMVAAAAVGLCRWCHDVFIFYLFWIPFPSHICIIFMHFYVHLHSFVCFIGPRMVGDLELIWIQKVRNSWRDQRGTNRWRLDGLVTKKMKKMRKKQPSYPPPLYQSYRAGVGCPTKSRIKQRTSPIPIVWGRYIFLFIQFIMIWSGSNTGQPDPNQDLYK